MSDDTTPPADPVRDRYPVEVVLSPAVYRQLAAIAALRGVLVEHLAADLVAQGLARVKAEERGPNLAELLSKQTAEIAALQNELDNARAQAQDAAQQLSKMTQGERGA